jgi:TrmH family RNA methyltransferase
LLSNDFFLIMLSKAKIKYIHSLEAKKQREKCGVFVVEGNKAVKDMLPFFDAELIVAENSWLATCGDVKCDELVIADDGDIQKASLQKSPQDVIAVFRKPSYALSSVDASKSLVLALDSVQDPGNLGTIIRVADWYGIENIVCGEGTVDAFSPKTVQATMGALSRVKVHYTNLKEYIIACKGKNIPVYGTFLDGDDMYEISLSSNGVIVMGNEGNGISRELDELISDRLYIPSFPADRETSESLNVAMATGIVCAEFRRRLRSLK